MNGFTKEIVLLFVGAVIGLASSLITTIINSLLKNKGSIKIYTKIIAPKLSGERSWGVLNTGNEMRFIVPLKIQIQNTTEVSQVVRNLNILLFNNGKEICSMKQINNTDRFIFANEGSYSFVIEPKSLKEYECFFMIKRNNLSGTDDFDELKLSYFDTKNRHNVFKLKDIDNAWENNNKNFDSDWILMSNKSK